MQNCLLQVYLNLSSTAIDNSNDETNFLHKFQVSSLLKVFAINSSASIKLSSLSCLK